MSTRFSLLLVALAPALAAQTSLETVVVSASRTPQPPEQVAFSTRTFDSTALEESPAVMLDGALRSAPAFSLFRRSDSLSANPTAQGVSLRGLGPSGASRSLVLLDGVPLNDPFGGWVDWTQLPREGLARVEIIPGGGATAWGNSALGGIVQLITEPATTAGGRLAASTGSFDTRSAELEVTQPVGRGAVQLLGSDFFTRGFSLVAPERRGPIDIAAWSRHRWIEGRWRTALSENLALTTTARDYEEFRGNGTPFTKNGTREKFFSATLAGQPAKDFAWNAVAYGQDQSFASTFSSVNATRTAETPASDQFAVPATAYGAAWTGVWSHEDGARTSFGFDGRTVRGETHENFTFSAGNFTRLRVAGGDQSVGGLFALHEQPLTSTVRFTLGVRLDEWHDSNGHRRETDRNTGAVLRDDHYATEDGTPFSPSADAVWTPAGDWRVHGSAQQAFRVPTLNELYRPFRQGTNVIETNPDLRTEHVTSAEVGVEWTPFGSGRPSTSDTSATPVTTSASSPAPLVLGATVFWNDLRNAVSNVAIARGPGTSPLFGTLAAGAVGRQRLNLDRTLVQGLEFSAVWQVQEALSVNAAAILNDGTVRRASVSPVLVGNRVAQVPRRSGSLGATWRAPGHLTFTPRVRWLGRQFEDDENTLILGEVAIVDLGASYRIDRFGELFVDAENLGNARIETGRTPDGVVNTGTPRLLLGGYRVHW